MWSRSCPTERTHFPLERFRVWRRGRRNPGETIVLYGLGFGPVIPNMPAGQIVTDANQLTLPFQILFAGMPAQVVYDGLVPGLVGVYQFNVVVPALADSDLVPLTFTLGDSAGSQTVFTAVHQ